MHKRIYNNYLNYPICSIKYKVNYMNKEVVEVKSINAILAEMIKNNHIEIWRKLDNLQECYGCTTNLTPTLKEFLVNNYK